MKIKEFVEYAEAITLAEIGFEFNWDDFEDSPFAKYVQNYPENGLSHVWPDENKPSHGYIYCPTYSQAFRWFREKYDVIGEVAAYYNPHRVDKLFYEYGISTKENTFEGLMTNAMRRIGEEWIDNPAEYNIFPTYEEAQLACLQQLIKIVQDGKKKD